MIYLSANTFLEKYSPKKDVNFLSNILFYFNIFIMKYIWKNLTFDSMKLEITISYLLTTLKFY